MTRPSHVLMAMGMDEDTARSAQRFTLGHSTTGADIARLIAAAAPGIRRTAPPAPIGSAKRGSICA